MAKAAKGTPLPISHEQTPKMVCPYCGHIHHDGFEYFVNRECLNIDCELCGKEFHAVQNLRVTYTTEKLGT